MAADPGHRLRRIAQLGEAVFLASLLLIAAILAVETFRFRSVPWDSLGMAFWPRIQLGILVVIILARLWHLRASLDTDRGELLQGLGVLLGCVGFVFGVALLGVYIATPPFFLLFGLLRKSEDRRRSILESLVASVVILLGVWLMFDQALDLRVLSLPIWMR